MIIFDLDGTLADCEHRRHFVDPTKNPQFKRRWEVTLKEAINNKIIPEEYIHVDSTRQDCLDGKYIKWKPGWKSFYEACDKDKYIFPVVDLFLGLLDADCDICIWSGRCESTRDKTEKWLYNKLGSLSLEPELIKSVPLKMRPIGDYTPDEQLKEKWLDETIANGIDIEYVFDDRPKVVMMWRRRGIFVFDCNQSGKEF